MACTPILPPAKPAGSLPPIPFRFAYRWKHRDILNEARTLASIRPTAVGKRLMPNNQVTGRSCDGDCSQLLQVLFARVGSAGQAAQPLMNLAVKTRNTGKSALLGGGISQIQQTLHPKWNRKLKAGIPVKSRTGKHPARSLGRIETHPVCGGPQIRRTPDLCECFVNARRLPDPLQGRVMKELHHNAVALADLIPGFRIIQFHTEPKPERLDRKSTRLNSS